MKRKPEPHARVVVASLHAGCARDSEWLIRQHLRHRERRCALSERDRAREQWVWATVAMLRWALEEQGSGGGR